MSFFAHEDKVNPKSLRSIDLHDHAAIIYESQQNKLHVIAELSRIGLERNEQVLIATFEGKEIEAHLRRVGIDVDSALTGKALIFEDVREIFPAQESFDPEKTIALFERKIHGAIDQGFSGLRVFNSYYQPKELGDVGVHVDFVSKMGRLMSERKVVRISLFDLNYLEPEVIINAILSHPIIVLRGIVCNNFFHIPPDQLLGPKGGSPEMYRLMDNLIDVHHKELILKESHEELESANSLLREEIKKRKMVEWALLISELRYRNTLDSISEPVIVIDRDYKIIVTNRALESLGDSFGKDFRCVGQHLKEAFPSLLKEEMEEYARVFAEGVTIVTRRLYEQDGDKLWAEVSKVPMMEGDHVVNVTTIIRKMEGKE